MSIVSLSFLLFLAAAVIVYYAVPKKLRWLVLLTASILFYCTYSVKAGIYVLVTAFSIYGAAFAMDAMAVSRDAWIQSHKAELSREERVAYKKKCNARRKYVMLGALLLNIGLLCAFKYAHFAVDILNRLTALVHVPAIANTWKWAVPLGISFYTFQTVGYLLDVYWENQQAEKNPLKLLLFTSFFPQMTQGPISDYASLAPQLYEGHAFDYDNFSRGFWRLIWGFAKKVLLANVLNGFVQGVFKGYAKMSGVTAFAGMLGYAIQLYADFSGYMDIMCGFSQMLGIRLTENFERPYFSKSVAEYWRRWHISLGEWFKKYIYFPAATAGWNRAISKKFKSKSVRQFLPATLALLVVWLATGLWHGASGGYVAWGLFNGLFIILTLWLEPVYKKTADLFHMRDDAFLTRLWRTARTFVLIVFIKVLPEVGTLSQGFGLWKRCFTGITKGGFITEIIGLFNGKRDLAVAVGMTAVLFVSSLLQRKKPLRDRFAKIPMPLRCAILAAVLVLVIVFGMTPHSQKGAFMYAQF